MDPAVTSLGIQTGVAGWDILQTKGPSDFPALTQDPVVRREITYFEQNAPKATTAAALLADPRLQDFALTAFGLSSQVGSTALMKKVLQSDPNSTSSFAAKMVSPQYTEIAAAFNYGGTVTPATPAVPSTAQVQVSDISPQSNFADFSGSFAGVSVSYVDLTQATSVQQVASKLQAAFRRADGNRTDISVTVDSSGNLKFADDLGRGSAAGFNFDANSLGTGTPAAASSPTNIVAGSQVVPASGGAAVTSPSFIQQVVNKYLEAQFEVVVGNSSNALREARYASQQLPTVTSWYSVIADKPLADVIQTVLGLPASFGALDVGQQANTLSQRMNISDFQNPAKLSKLLTQFVATSGVQNQSSAAIAATLLNTFGSTNIINVTVPSSTTPVNTFSNASTAALILSTAFPQTSG
jgi:hypothetical protein